MTPTEGKYWGDWRKICRAKGWQDGDSSKRHAMHKMALGENKSHTLFTQADWDRVFNLMRTLANSTDLDAQIERIAYERHDAAQAAHEPVVEPGTRTKPCRRRRAWASRYEQMTAENDPGERRRLNYALRIFEPALIASICRDRFDVADWNTLSIPQLTDLRDLLNNRLYAWMKEVKAGRIEYHFPFPLYDEQTGRTLSNKAIRAALMRLGVAVKLSSSIKRAEYVEGPF